MDGLSWYERAVLKTLRELHEYNRSFIHTRIIAGFLDKNDRIIRGVLVRLEHKQAVQRKGQRGGWKPLDARVLAATPARWYPQVVFKAPKLEVWQPSPKQSAEPVMLTEYLSATPLQAVI